MRTPSRIRLAGLLALGLVCTAPRVGAHGGLPISQSIMWRGDTMVVPTPYWGLFLGTDNRPWHWICDEAINTNQQRLIAMSSDGLTFYATDVTGLTLSPDGGCSWAPVTGVMAKLDVVSVLADPVESKLAYVLANSSADSTQTGLWRTSDAGLNWQLVRALGDELPGGLAISFDGKRIAVSSLSRTQPRAATLHSSVDAGLGFTSRVLTLPLMGAPVTNLTPLWIDAAAPGTGALYLRTVLDAEQLLLRDSGSGDPVVALRSPSALLAMARDPQAPQTLLVATSGGLYVQQSDQSFQLDPVLGSVQCLSPHNGTLYLCAWNYPPDNAAIARLQVGAHQFSRVFQYNQVQGPLDCPATTKVGNLCPKLWTSYANQLGVEAALPDMAGTAPPAPAGTCQFGGVAAGAVTAAGAGGLLTMAAMLLALRRRAAPRR